MASDHRGHVSDAAFDSGLQAAEDLQKRIWEQIPAVFNLNSAERRLCIGLFDLASDHLDCIRGLLAAADKVGSAFALARPAVEACYRIHYLMVHDGAELHERILSGEARFPDLGGLVRDVEGHYRIQGAPGIFSAVEQHRALLNALTHGGIEQILARFNEAWELVPSYPRRSQLQLLRVCLGHYVIAALGIVQLFRADDPDRCDAASLRLLNLMRSVAVRIC